MIERLCTVQFCLSCSIASHNCYLYLKNYLDSSCYISACAMLSGPQCPAFLTDSSSSVVSFQVPRRMWIILGVNVKCLNIEGPDQKHDVRHPLHSYLQISWNVTASEYIRKTPKMVYSSSVHMGSFLHLPSRLAFASQMFHYAHFHSSWFHLAIMRNLLKQHWTICILHNDWCESS